MRLYATALLSGALAFSGPGSLGGDECVSSLSFVRRRKADARGSFSCERVMNRYLTFRFAAQIS
jgi:hypothetical protein